MNVKCPVCGRPARRDPDTLDTFVCSSWYYLRYPDNKNAEKAFDREKIDRMLPVDKYIGGAEHACMHLLYARFFTKALRDMGYLDFDEPFLSLVHQGTILGSDGFKMSKSRGNVVSPDDSIEKYGADVFRMYLMFGFSYVEGGPWNDNGIESMAKFFDRVERLIRKGSGQDEVRASVDAREKLDYVRNNTIKCVSADIENFSFNTAIARIMEFVNAVYDYVNAGGATDTFFEDCRKDLVRLLAPFAPHFAEELWEILGQEYSVFNQPFPVCNEDALVLRKVELAVQVNSRIRAKVTVASDATREEIEKAALAALEGQLEGAPKKIIVVPGRLVNIIA